MTDIEQIKNLEKLKATFMNIKTELKKCIIGQDDVIELLLIAILCNGNALLESYPGLGKTTMISSLAKILDLSFSRIQNTPDLMPSDITGTFILEEQNGKRNFKFQEGPIFANIVLADEINRATPKTQAALLEAMQEKQVTAGNKTFQLDQPFFVLATQNPIDQEGTYPLPEAQTDRFLFKILVDYPKLEEELEIVNLATRPQEPPKLNTMLGKNSLLLLQKLTKQIPIAEDMKKKAIQIVAQTRTNKDLFEYGASPRASITLILASKARALIHGRKFVAEQDIEAMVKPVLRHRVILNFQAERDGITVDKAIEMILGKAK